MTSEEYEIRLQDKKSTLYTEKEILERLKESNNGIVKVCSVGSAFGIGVGAFASAVAGMGLREIAIGSLIAGASATFGVYVTKKGIEEENENLDSKIDDKSREISRVENEMNDIEIKKHVRVR